MAQKKWNPEELKLQGALESGIVRACSLTGLPSQKIFSRKAFEYVSDNDWNTLLPSIAFASHLVELGLPYLTNFLPSKNLRRSGQPSFPIQLREKVSQRDIDEAQQELDDISKFVRWQVCKRIYKSKGWFGISWRLDRDLQHEELINWEDDVDENHELWNRQDRMLMTVGITQMYLDKIRESPPESAKRLRYTFMAGVTLAHEVAHVVNLQDEKNDSTFGDEPYTEGDCQSELGNAFISRLFGGYCPLVSEEHDSFTYHLDEMICYWDEQFKMSIEARPLYKTLYSIPIKYIEEKMSNSFWDTFCPTKPAAYEEFRRRLDPEIMSQPDNHATALLRQWTYANLMVGSLTWKGDFRKRQYAIGAPVCHSIPQDELDVARFEFDEVRARPGCFASKFMGKFGHQYENVDDDEDIFEDYDGSRPLATSSLGNGIQVSGGAFGRYNDVEEKDRSGLLLKDVSPLLEHDQVEPALVRVAYRIADQDEWLRDGLSSKRRRSAGSSDDYRISKFAKLYIHDRQRGSYTRAETHYGAGPDGNLDVNQALRRLQINPVSENEDKNPRWGSKEVLDYLLGKRSFKPLHREYLSRKPYLDYGHLYDRPVIAIFREHKIKELEPYFVNDPCSLCELSKASIAGVEDWAEEDLQDFHLVHGIPSVPMSVSHGTTRMGNMVSRVQRWKETELICFPFSVDQMKAHCEPEYRLSSRSELISVAAFGAHHVKPRIFRYLNFGAVLGHSSVDALKRAIRSDGGIALKGDAPFSLRFKMGRGVELLDGKPLSHYAGRDFREILFEAAQPDVVEINSDSLPVGSGSRSSRRIDQMPTDPKSVDTAGDSVIKEKDWSYDSEDEDVIFLGSNAISDPPNSHVVAQSSARSDYLAGDDHNIGREGRMARESNMDAIYRHYGCAP